MVIEFTAPVRIESEANTRCHWAARKKRFDEQRMVTRCAMRNCGTHPGFVIGRNATVTLTRVGPRRLDDDNLAGGFKAVRDEIARILNVDDGDPRVTWRYEQERGAPKQYAIRVKIESMTPHPNTATP
jgi:hypothetical protein